VDLNGKKAAPKQRHKKVKVAQRQQKPATEKTTTRPATVNGQKEEDLNPYSCPRQFGGVAREKQ